MLYEVFSCTYSAIFISSPVLIYLGIRSSETPCVAEGKIAPAESGDVRGPVATTTEDRSSGGSPTI
jgi:hypothetical protein